MEKVISVLFLFCKFINMKKIILKSINLIIKMIEKLEDNIYWYHIDLDTWNIQVWNYTIK
mgnify:CR=1 FL=1